MVIAKKWPSTERGHKTRRLERFGALPGSPSIGKPAYSDARADFYWVRERPQQDKGNGGGRTSTQDSATGGESTYENGATSGADYQNGYRAGASRGVPR